MQKQQSENDFVHVQNLPRRTPPKPFHFAGRSKQLNTGKVFLLPEENLTLRFGAEQPAPFRNGRIVSIQFNRQQQTSSLPPSPLLQQQILFEQNQRAQSLDTEYGAPADPINHYGPPPSTQIPPETEPETEEVIPEVTPTDDSVIAIANAGENGQYYILGKDNILQRVVYTTTQTEDDRVHNGFTAQLRYEPVQPIRDPVYAYDAQGELVRIYNKK